MCYYPHTGAHQSRAPDIAQEAAVTSAHRHGRSRYTTGSRREHMQRRNVIIAGLAAAIASPARAATRPAVLELFTSQGCSSCPPAEALLGQLVRQPGIIALAWHVDYWNGLGWRDPYSSPTATERQRRYAESLLDEVYTPALVVNGARMVVGSDSSAVQAAIG